MTPDSITPGTHVSDDDLAAYFDSRLAADERKRVESHLASCDECRAEAIAARDAIASAPAVARPKRAWRLIGAATAAAVVLVVATTLTRTPKSSDAVRDEATDLRPAVTVVTPGDNARLMSDRRFVWRSIADGASYRLTIGDDSGQPIYSITVQDTTAVAPSSVPFAAGRKFFWYVDAIRADGETATSGLKSFTIE